MCFYRNKTILALVGYAWAGFGASFGPVILLSLYWKRMTKWGALAGMIAGATNVIIWTQFHFLKNTLYEMVPGFAANLLAIVVFSLLTKAPAQVKEEFEKVQQVS